MTDATIFLQGAVTRDAPQLPAVNSGGRPTDYSPNLAETICERIADGATLRAICADKDMPHRATVFRWLDQHADFRLLYTYAMQAKIEGHVEEIIEIADDKSQDFKLEDSGEGGPAIITLDKEAIARSKLRIETRQWIAKVSLPRKYGDLIGKEPEIPLAGPGDDAKVVGATVIENDPLYASFAAYEKVGNKP